MEDKEREELRRSGIEIKEEMLGAYTGEFPTILVAMLGGIAAGLLSAIGREVWEVLKSSLSKRVRKMELDRQSKEDTREGRCRVVMVYIVGELSGVPVVYYSAPDKEVLNLEFDREHLEKAESDIRIMIKAGECSQNQFLGINLKGLGHGTHLRQFKSIPSEGSIIDEITRDSSNLEALTHADVGYHLEQIGMPDEARRHYELAILGLPEMTELRVSVGCIYANEGNLEAALEYWNAAAKIDGKVYNVHYNTACFYARRGDVTAASRELRLAVEHGFRSVGWLLKDPEFAPIINHPEILAIVEEIRAKLRK